MQETVRDSGWIPGLGRSPGGGNGNPLQYSCLENPMDGGAWRAAVHGVTRSWPPPSYLACSTCRGQCTPQPRPLAQDYSPGSCLWSRGQAGAVLGAHPEFCPRWQRRVQAGYSGQGSLSPSEKVKEMLQLGHWGAGVNIPTGSPWELFL